MSGVVEKIKDKVEQVLHKDNHNAHAAGTHTTGAHTTGTHTTGTHTTGAHAAGTHGHSTNTGPHGSNLANKVDPRVDSDRDGSGNMGAANYGPGGHTTGTGFGTGAGTHSTNTTAGPHDSNIANKVDPRVDSDRDGSRNMGAANYGPGGHATGTHAGITGTGTHSGMAGSGTNTAGPHNSDLLNKVDPRVDSDRDGSRNLAAANYGPGGQATGTHTGTTGTYTAGPHDSNLLNKADPRVDSDRDGSRNLGAANYGPGGQATGTHTGMTGSGQSGLHSGTGPAPSTAGPHSSNLANKLDPRVDSDLDGSRRVGGDQTTGGNQNY